MQQLQAISKAAEQYYLVLLENIQRAFRQKYDNPDGINFKVVVSQKTVRIAA